MHQLERNHASGLGPTALGISTLVDALPVLACTGRADGTGLEFANRRFVEYTGAATAQLSGWGWTTCIHADDRERVLDELAAALDRPLELELRLRGADGTHRWFLLRAEPWRDTSETVVGWCGVLTDIERQHRAFDSLPGIVCTNTPEGKIEDVNAAAVEFYGRSREDLRNWAVAVHPDDVPMVVARKAQAVATGEPMDFDVRNRRADGVYRWLHCRSLPQRDREGRIVRWYSLLTDIDDRRQAEEALRSREREYRSIIDTVPGLVAIWTPDGRAEFVNAQLLAYIGQDLTAIQGWQASDIIHADDRPRVTAAWAHAMTSGEPFDSEHRLRRSDGVYRWFHVRAVPDRDPDGHIIRWPVLITDVDARKRAEEERRRSEAFLVEVQRLSRTGGFRYDPVADRVESSAEIERAYGVRPGDDVTSPAFWFGRIHPDDRPRVQAAFEQCVRARTAYRADYRILRGDGTIGYQYAVGRPVLDAAGDLVEYIGASMDMTDQWLASQELAQASRAIGEMQGKLSRAAQVATVGELAAAIAHEVNQPLAAVVTNAHACLRWLSGPTPNVERAVEAAERIASDGRDAADVVTRVRSLFKRTPTENALLDLNEVIREVLRLLEVEFTRKQVVVASILDPTLSGVRGDRVQLQQLVWNLAVNALEAVAGVTDRERHVSVLSRRSGPHALLEVSDNGSGLSHPDVVFEPFFTTKADGLGMGLTICRSIATAHGGRLSAVSHGDRGTTFSFTMPLAPDGRP
ncbi:PAS domain-containing sensor histidine kinase [Luteitalea sp. TBR-22]|uniref:PAS domain-containing protein n=1 Tax=Luteitalea sp. TBR-22 TaxID=2802971 RepID=UPI001AF81583|nr:PAS domain-containing protein [Luteitalea sp. TBR-22]BCS32589.1 PAS domain-containing sensor histidine kinase [Luteitalea sp. TBR-22]